MNPQTKVKHHYVPEVYMKGFTMEDEDKVYVLRKPRHNISSMHPAQIMYDKHLYTVSFQNERSQMIEDFYSEVESELSGAFRLMNELRHNPKEYLEAKNTVEFHQLLKVIIALQFWRTPCQRDLAKEYASNLIGLYDSANEMTKKNLGYDRKFIKYLYAHREKDSHLTVIQNSLLPLLTFKMLDESLIDFSFYVAEQDQGLVLTCDNPVVYSDLNELFDFKVFAFPLTKNIIVASSVDEGALDIYKFNQKMYTQARERVIGSREEYFKEFQRSATGN